MLRTDELLRVFHAHRGDAIVVPGRGGRHWGKISTRPGRDLPMGDPAMGGHAGFALGLALALPQNKVVLFDSEGDLLMSLGILPTVAELAPGQLLPLHARQRVLRDHRWAARAQRQERGL
jgi:thiamine pyrophosphate-dependent acetolactate synthase large subunit-like protein